MSENIFLLELYGVEMEREWLGIRHIFDKTGRMAGAKVFALSYLIITIYENSGKT